MRLVASSRLVAMATADKPEIASPPPRRTVRVAVVGAGSSGLAAARELSLAGHQVTVFERGRRLGGLWASSGLEAEGEEGAEGDNDDDGAAEEKMSTRVHSSLYPSLRTNLPRILMGFASYPFTREAMELTAEEKKKGADKGGGGGEEKKEAKEKIASLDFLTYPRHDLVLRYLQSYSDEFGLERFVRYGRELVRASPVFSTTRGRGGRGGGDGDDGETEEEEEALPWPRWRVVTRATVPAGETGDAFLPFDPQERNDEGGGLTEEVFDALVCCSGHFAKKRLPPSALAAIEMKKRKSPLAFPGLILHAHSYRGPTFGPLAKVLSREKKKNEEEEIVVAVVGAGPSGEDIAREVSAFADRVLLCSASGWGEDMPLPRGVKNNIEPRPFVVGLDAEGVRFGGRDEGGGGENGDGDGGGENGGASSPSPPPPPVPSSSSPEFPPPERVDAVIYATGYLYDFPELSGTIAVEDNEVLQAGGGRGARGGAGEEQGGGQEERPHQPLWEHLFCPALSVGLSLLGLPFKVVPFPLVEAQARLVATALALVPSERGGGEEEEEGGERRKEVPAAAFPWTAEEMAAAALAAARERAERGVARRHTHRMGCPSHFEYIDRLIDATEALERGRGGGGGGGNGGGGDDEHYGAAAVVGNEDNNVSCSPLSSPPPPSSPETWRLAPWRQAMYMRASEARRRDADSYRDSADLGEDNVREAEAEASAWLAFRKKKKKKGQE